MSIKREAETPLFCEILVRERKSLSLTQKDLADRLDIDPKNISRWETGQGWPGIKNSKKLCDLFQKSPEQMGLTQIKRVSTKQPAPTPIIELPPDRPPLLAIHNEDEENAEIPPSIEMYGRVEETGQLKAWIEEERCRIVIISSIGGAGKTTLASKITEQLKAQFTYIYWASLKDIPSLHDILTYSIQRFSNHQETQLPNTIEGKIFSLINYLKKHRCLLILDNFESVLQEGQNTGQYRSGYEGYGELLHYIGETEHQSCLLLTSREKPEEVASLIGKKTPVRELRLRGLDERDGSRMLEDRGLHGTPQELEALVQLFSGNPLALQLVAETVQEVFGGSIPEFLAQKGVRSLDIYGLLDEQYQRLSIQEQEVLYWLAIEREVVSLNRLQESLLQRQSHKTLPTSIKSLLRRSMIEARGPGLFTLQPVIMEYIATRIIERFVSEFGGENIDVWRNYALMKAQAKDYIRESQMRLFLVPITERLQEMYSQEALEQKVKEHLANERRRNGSIQSYLAGTVLNLLITMQGDLRGFDFSSLTIRQAYLQNILLPGINFTSSRFINSIFTSTQGNVLAVAFSKNDELLAVGTAKGEIILYDRVSGNQVLSCEGHTDGVNSLAFNQAGNMLASGSDDSTIRLWNTANGTCLKTLRGHQDRVRSVTFHPNGTLLASGSADAKARVWDVKTGATLFILEGHTDHIWSLAFNPTGDLLATASTDQTIRLWEIQAGTCLRTLTDHTGWVIALAFDPHGRFLASGGDDRTIRLWDTGTWSCVNVLEGHSKRIRSLSFSRDGAKLASGSEDQTIQLWDIETGQITSTLQGHTHGIRSIAFTSGGTLLASGGDDQTARLWEVSTGYCLRTVQGYTNRVLAALLSVDEQTLVSCSEDKSIRIWDLHTKRCRLTLHEPAHGVYCIAYSNDGQTLVSGGEDMTLRVWNIQTGRCLNILEGHTGWIRSVAFSPDGTIIASGSEDQSIRLWENSSGRCIRVLDNHTGWVRSIAFSADGTLLASGSDDRTVRLWNPLSGDCLAVLRGHSGNVRSVAFSADGSTLVSGSEDQTLCLWNSKNSDVYSKRLNAQVGWVRSLAIHPDGKLIAVGGDDTAVRLWDIEGSSPLRVLRGHTSRVRWVSFSSDGNLLITSSDDGTVKLWNIETGLCKETFIGERPYERMDITNVQGLAGTQKATLRALGAIERKIH